jgi:hypothetical protein
MNNCYVYGYYDPITNELFYVGKGTGYRDKSHLKASNWKEPKKTTNPFLYYKIRSLMERKTPPRVVRLFENLTEDEAYTVETELIEKYGRRFSPENGKLFNISEYKGGNKRGKVFLWTDERKQKHQEMWRSKRKYDPTYEEIYDDYIIKNLSREEIAKKEGVSEALVKKRLQHYGIIKPKELCYSTKNTFCCISCKEEFATPNSVNGRKYCSRKCYREYRRKHKDVL